LKPLRDSLIRACENYNADEALRAMGSAMTTMLVGTTPNADAAYEALDKLFEAMRPGVEQIARAGRRDHEIR
jgi:hypothetical protein